MENVERLTNILKRLNNTVENPSFEENDKNFLADASCRDLARAQENLLASGIATSELWRMWNRNARLLPNQSAKLRAELPRNHILQTILAEHDMILCFIADLDDVNNKLQSFPYAASSTMEIRKLAHIAAHLVSSEQHHEREEQIIFPELKLRGYHRLLEIINDQHLQIIQRGQRLKDLVWDVDRTNFDAFKSRLDELANYLVVAIQVHIFIETNIIFPLAIEVINDRRVWERMKETCDQIGYCGYDAML